MISQCSRHTDIDEENVKTSSKNVSENGLKDRIQVVKTDPSDGLIPLHTKLGIERYDGLTTVDAAYANRISLDFTMCNPPFYTSREEMIGAAQAKERPPFSVRHIYSLVNLLLTSPGMYWCRS